MKKIIVLCLVALFSIGLVEAQTPKKGGKNLTTTVFMTNLDCQGCAKKITDNIPLAKGVEDVKALMDADKFVLFVVYGIKRKTPL